MKCFQIELIQVNLPSLPLWQNTCAPMPRVVSIEARRPAMCRWRNFGVVIKALAAGI